MHHDVREYRHDYVYFHYWEQTRQTIAEKNAFRLQNDLKEEKTPRRCPENSNGGALLTRGRFYALFAVLAR